LNIYAVELETKSSKFIILSFYSAYRVSNQFIKNLDDALKHLYKPKVELLIYEDINTVYLIEIN
jgi:hypothetical protein